MRKIALGLRSKLRKCLIFVTTDTLNYNTFSLFTYIFYLFSFIPSFNMENQYHNAYSSHSSLYISFGFSYENLIVHREIPAGDVFLFSHEPCV